MRDQDAQAGYPVGQTGDFSLSVLSFIAGEADAEYGKCVLRAKGVLHMQGKVSMGKNVMSGIPFLVKMDSDS